MQKNQQLENAISQWVEVLLRDSLHDLNRYTRENGLTLVQMNVLLHLYYQGASEVTQFCNLMQISPAGASQMIERLVHLKAVQRCEVPGDRRVRRVSLTEDGQRMVEASLKSRDTWIRDLAGEIPQEDGEKIAEALAKLIDHARRLEVHP